MKSSYVYILASSKYGTLYVGVTGDLFSRVQQHKSDLVDGFTKRYNVHDLVYYEEYENIEDAIMREKRIKRWNLQWKIDLIEKENPGWRDMFSDFMDSQSSWE